VNYFFKLIYKIVDYHLAKAFIAFSLGVIIFISCISYNPYDPSLNVATNQITTNFLGFLGSCIADIFIQIFGLGSHIFAFALIYWSIVIIRNKQLPYCTLKLFSLLVCGVSCCVMLSWYDSGGLIGSLAKDSDLMIKYFALLNFILFLSFVLYIPRSERFVAVRKELPKETKISKIYQPEKKVIPQAFKKRNDQNFQLPDLNLLHEHDKQNHKQETKAQIEQNAADLLKTLGDFGVRGKIISISQGPVVTLYEFEPAAGTKSSRVIGLAGDIARSLSAVSARISTIAGRNALGIELPNANRQFFGIKELIQTTEYNDSKNTLPIVLGKDIGGKPLIVDLAKMPHLLIAGTTGSGKSVGINTMIMSLLYRYTPDECKLIMIDPKMLELSVYDDIPHLLTPVVTESSKAVQALKWAVREMEQRYRLMSQIGVRNITNYNQRVLDALNKGEGSNDYKELVSEAGKYLPEGKLKTMPFIVIIVDEMADLMLVSGKEIESYIQRLAQMARAAGLHLITATQRPSVDVITGVIKANFPSRISFKVTSKIDSRTILGEMGAEQLLGMGDMLYMGNGSKITRVHGPFVGDREVEDVVEFLKSQGTPEYVSAVTALDEDSEGDMFFEGDGGDDDKLYAQALQIIKRDRKCSTSYIQRCLRIGYNRAAILIERMEKEGIISEPNHSGKREIFME